MPCRHSAGSKGCHRFVLIYGTLPVVLAEDADVCPDGSVLGGIDTCVNYTNEYDGGPCHGGTMRYPCACVEGYTPYATRFYIWSLGCSCPASGTPKLL